MSTSTVYDVQVRYGLDDRATKGAKTMAGEFDRAGRSAMSLRGAIAGIGIAGVFVAGKRALIDFNSEIDQMRIGMTTIMNMQLKKPWAEASKAADGLFARFQELAKKSPATTKDFITMANALTPQIASMGGGVDKIEKLTQGAVLAGLATGTRADVAALDVKQMLAGTVTERDMMAKQLISAQGMTKEDFNKLDGGSRGAMVEKMLTHPSLLRAAEEFGASFAGQVSTFKDQLQIALGKVGKPLMESMTAEVKKWNQWIEKNPQTIARISKSLSGALVSTFKFIRDSVGWLVDNREMIFSVAKVFLAFKGAQMATNVFATFVGGLKRLGDSFSNTANTFAAGGAGLSGKFSRLGAILGGAGGVIPMFAALSMVGFDLWKRMTAIGREEEKAKVNRDQFKSAQFGTLSGDAKKAAQLEQKLEADMDRRREGKAPLMSDITRSATFTELEETRAKLADVNKMAPLIRHLSDRMDAAGMGGLEGMDPATMRERFKGGVTMSLLNTIWGDGNKDAKKLSNDFAILFQQLSKLKDAEIEAINALAFPELAMQKGLDPAQMPESKWGDPGAGEKTNINVTIHRIEVAADDPDRFVFGMVKALNNVSKNPTQAASAIGD